MRPKYDARFLSLSFSQLSPNRRRTGRLSESRPRLAWPLVAAKPRRKESSSGLTWLLRRRPNQTPFRPLQWVPTRSSLTRCRSIPPTPQTNNPLRRHHARRARAAGAADRTSSDPNPPLLVEPMWSSRSSIPVVAARRLAADRGDLYPPGRGRRRPGRSGSCRRRQRRTRRRRRRFPCLRLVELRASASGRASPFMPLVSGS